MATKKKNTEEFIDIEELPSVLEEGNYYTALVKVKGKRELVKIRGIVGVDYVDDACLYNNQGVGDEADCEEGSGFSFVLDLYGNTQEHLDKAGVKEFTILTDKRAKAVIDNDKLPLVAGHQAKITRSGMISFGCGAITVSKEDAQSFVNIMTKISAIDGIERFLDIVSEMAEQGVSPQDVNLADVRKILSIE